MALFLESGRLRWRDGVLKYLKENMSRCHGFHSSKGVSDICWMSSMNLKSVGDLQPESLR